MRRVVHWIFIVLFLGGAVVQYNDPDLHLWVLIYGVAAGLTFDSLRGRCAVATAGVFALGCAAYALQLTIEVLRDGNFLDPVWIVGEKGREFLGLYGLAVFTGWLIVSSRRHDAASS